MIRRLLNVTGRVLEYVHRLRMKTSHAVTSETTSDGSKEVEIMWIWSAQLQLTQDSKLKGQFGLFLNENGVWRCGGRLSKASIMYGAKHPILLLRQHHLTTLVVRRAHLRVFHNGVKETFAGLRSKFWNVKGRLLVKKLIQRCIVCKRFLRETAHWPISTSTA